MSPLCLGMLSNKDFLGKYFPNVLLPEFVRLKAYICRDMENSIAQALNEANWEEMIPKLVRFADKHMRYILANFEHPPVIHGYVPKTIVQESITRTMMPNSRNWDPSKVSLLNHLYGVIRSIVDCEMKKHCKIEIASPSKDDSGKLIDPSESVPDDGATPEEVANVNLITERQRTFLDSFMLTIEDDEELSALLLAMMDGVLKNREISSLTGIPSNRVSELKRKLRGRLEAFAFPDLVPLESNLVLTEMR